MLLILWIESGDKSARPTRSTSKQQSRPTVPCDGPRMNRQVDVGNPPRPFRHLRMAERCTPDPSSSRAPVHSALVQKSVTAITNPAGRLSQQMLGELRQIRKRKAANSWQITCNQSNRRCRFEACNLPFTLGNQRERFKWGLSRLEIFGRKPASARLAIFF